MRGCSGSAILLIDTEAPQLAVWRGDGDTWTRSEQQSVDPVVDLPENGARPPLAELYDGVAFETG